MNVVHKIKSILKTFWIPAFMLVAVLTEAVIIRLVDSWLNGTAPWWILLLIVFFIGGLFGFLAWKWSETSVSPAIVTVSGPLNQWVTTLPNLAGTELVSSNRDKTGIFANIQKMIAHFVRSVHIIGMQAGNASALIMELIQIHKFLYKDVNSLFKLAKEIDLSNNQLAEEVLVTKNQLNRISTNMDLLSTSSIYISGSIENVAQASKGAENNLHSMAQAAKRMVTHLNNVFEQLNLSLDSALSVGESTKRMVQSFDEVRHQCYVANNASGEANHATSEFSTLLIELANATKEIDSVVDFIYEIADQTNMLALNAAIEAAGAGESGKGFAVVASEIKSLAQKTVRAMGNIEEKIEEIQTRSAEASAVAGKVFELVDRIHEVNQGIAQAIDDQHEATQHVSQSMEQVKDAMSTIMQSTKELESATRSVAEEAARGVVSVEEISLQASQVSETAGEMERQTTEARTFSLSTYEHAMKTNDLSKQVKERVENSLRMTRFLHGSINHFGVLSDIARETNDSFHNTLLTFNNFSEPFELFRFKSDTLSMMGQLEKAAYGNVKLKNDTFASWEKSEVGRWLLANQDTPLIKQPLFEEVKKNCQSLYAAASKVIASLHENRLELVKDGMNDVHIHRRRMFVAMDELYLSPFDVRPKHTNLVEWQPTLNIGIPEIDQDHQKLFSMLNLFHNSFHSAEGRSKQQDILQNLFKHAKEHFALEERLMKQSEYPQSKEHQAQHLGFLAQAEKFSDSMNGESHTLLLDLSIFVRNWFSFHISKWDQEMGLHLPGKKK